MKEFWLVFGRIEVDGDLEGGGGFDFDGPVEEVVPLEVAIVVVDDDFAALELVGLEVLAHVDFAGGLFLEGVEGGEEHGGVEGCGVLAAVGVGGGGDGDAFDAAGVVLQVAFAVVDGFACGGGHGDGEGVVVFADGDDAVVQYHVGGIACGEESGVVVVVFCDGTFGCVEFEAFRVDVAGGYGHGDFVGGAAVLDGELHAVGDG